MRFFVDVLLVNEPRVADLAAKLGIARAHAYGCVVALRSWSVEHAPDGQLPMLDELIADAGLWRGDASAFVSALTPAFITAKRKVVDWDDFAGKVLSRLEFDRERKRGGSGGDSSGGSGGGSTKRSTRKSARNSATEVRSKIHEPLTLTEESREQKSEEKLSEAGASAGGLLSLADARSASKPASDSWSRQACEDWEARFGVGSVAAGRWGGRIGGALKRLVDAQGWAAVRPAWQEYLRRADASYVDPGRFAGTWQDWADGRRPSREVDPVTASINATLAEMDPTGEGMERALRTWGPLKLK